MTIFSCSLLLVLFLYLVEAQYIDNRDHDQYYVRHSPAVNHRSVSGLQKNNNGQQSNDDLPSSQSLFMMDFKRQAIVIPETGEKLSSKKSTSSSLFNSNLFSQKTRQITRSLKSTYQSTLILLSTSNCCIRWSP